VIGFALPSSAALTELLLEPARVRLETAELSGLRIRLLGELPRLAEKLPPGERLQLGTYELLLARRHPEGCGLVRGGFVPSPVRARRAIGLLAVERCVRGRVSAPQTAVAEVLASGIEELADDALRVGGGRPRWWARWYASLGPGGRAIVQAEAATWATQLWTALEWHRFERPPVVGGRDDYWDCPGRRRLLVRSRAEVRALAHGRSVLLVVGSGCPGPGWRAELANRALVLAMARGERSVPARVVGLWPASGTVRTCEVGIDALSEAADELVSAAAVWVEARVRARREEAGAQLRGPSGSPLVDPVVGSRVDAA